MRLAVLAFLLFAFSQIALADPYKLSENYKWFLDLGGKTIDAAGNASSVTGIRGGVILPSGLAIGGAVFTLTKQPVEGDNDEKLNTYSFAGVHAEYVYAQNKYVAYVPSILMGIGYGEHETRDQDLVSVGSTTYYSIEPGFSVSIRMSDKLRLNVGGSYFLVDNEAGLKSGPSLNIFARYLW
jgi:hypothetical protein